ncbi:manganese efflux pump MntP family protein [Candidatus Zixiibacteriota bacterium]
MNLFTTTIIALGLAMDALAVSIASGVAIKDLRAGNALRIGIFFGSFQALMPVIGWLAGNSLRDYISGVDHWIAFGLLGCIGCKMIYESAKIPSRRKDFDPLSISVLLVLSIATSIDALAVGISFAFIRVAIITPIIMIGVITFLLSFIGTYIGNKMGHFFERKIEFIGGLVLIVIGAKILIEHLI